jgi:hypothetical protein
MTSTRVPALLSPRRGLFLVFSGWVVGLSGCVGVEAGGAAEVDGSVDNGGPVDGGGSVDGGWPTDGGGSVDGGWPTDGGGSADGGGSVDGGWPTDGGGSLDGGGLVDGGGDAGTDAADAAGTTARGIQLIAPVNDITTPQEARNPAFRWSKSGFYRYVITVERKRGQSWGVLFQKRDTEENLCPGDVCSVRTGFDYYQGKYRWTVTNGPGDVSSSVTIRSTAEDPAKADIASVGAEETIGRGAKAPSIAVDANRSPHVVACHKNGEGFQYALRMYNKKDGAWSQKLIAWTQLTAPESSSTGIPASRIYIPDIVIDAQNRGWVYARVASQEEEGGTLLGHSIWLFNDITTADPQVSRYKHFPRNGLYGRQANLALDAFQPGFVYMAVGSKVSAARWHKIDSNLNEVEAADVPMGSSGEKFRFEISSRQQQPRVLHLVGLGDTVRPNVYQNSVLARAGDGSVAWLPMGAFGEDFTHPSVGIDSARPLVAYLGVQTSIGGNGMRINIWDGTKMLFEPENAPRFDGTAAEDPYGNGEGRFGPQWTPALGGGAFVCWTSPARTIKLRYVKPWPIDSDYGPITEVANGAQCSLATDARGDLHLVYGNGDLKYRKITTR